MMKSFSKLMFAALLATGFWACSDEVDVPDNGGTETTDKVYMSFDLQLPTATRSATDATGTTNSDATPDSEEGTDAENAVSSMCVVLATKDNSNNFTQAATSNLLKPQSTDNPDGYTGSGDGPYIATFEEDALNIPEGTSVTVFVVCNPSVDATGNPDVSNLFTKTGTVAENDKELTSTIAKAHNFLMTNAKATTTITMPSTAVLNASTKSNPIDLGEVQVERVAARFDYKDGSPATTEPHTYPIENTGVNVVLTDIALMNLSKNYYYLRRVSPRSSTNANQYTADSYTIAGTELNNNFVVDTDAADKLSEKDLSVNYFYHVGSKDAINPTSTSFDYKTLSDLSTDDKWTGADGYKVWRYATENTMPSVNSQLHKYTTGVIFKGKLTETTTDENSKLLDGTNAVYVFGNKLYGSWAKVKAAATSTNADASLKAAYESIANGDTAPDKSDAANVGFTVYEPTDDGVYNVYYYYWNRHNDNATSNDKKETEMGIMEYAVVRNNVYKLSVTDINLFGHPADPEGDPDPEDPEDPDEEKITYLRVSVRVLPWVVRVNNIEF